MATRDTIFLSHATPADNEFVRWLGTRLTGHGYRVWADLFELKGGTPFWSAIEKCIRERTFKVVAVISRVSCDPNTLGFQNEVALADTVKKELKDDGFIIPVRIDQTPFSQIPIQIHRLNAIDFSKGWGSKLDELLETLASASTPRTVTDLTAEFDRWRAASVRSSVIAQSGVEPLLTNVLPILELPTELTFYEYAGENKKFEQALTDTLIPHAFHDRLFVSFFTAKQIQDRLPPPFSVGVRSTVSLESFIEGSVTDPTGPKARDARAMVVRMLRESCECYLEHRGMKRHLTSRGSTLFFPKGLIPDDKVFYTNAAGKRTWKQVVGYSAKLRIHWHLGFKILVRLDERVIRLRSFVVFSEDGQTPLSDADRAIKIRRRFCKSWFNNVWRPLYEAFYTFLNQGNETVLVPLGGNSAMTIAGFGLRLESAMQMPEDLLTPDPDEPEDIDGDDIDTPDAEDADDEK